MITEMQHMSLQEVSARTEAFVAEMSKPLEHYSETERELSMQANAQMRGLYARAFMQLMHQNYIIDDHD